MDDRYQPERMDDRDEPRRRRPDDDDDYPRRRPPPRPGSKGMSVVGLIALIVGVISFVLSMVPCLNLFTWPLQVIGLILALIGVGISAFGQREGLGLPISGLAVNALACAVPVAMYLGFCGLGMQGARQAAQEAADAVQAEQERLDQLEAERRRTEATKVATVSGLGAGFDGVGVLLCLPPLAYNSLSYGQSPDALVVDLDKLVREFEENEVQAKRKYLDRTLVIEGTVDWGGTDHGHVFLELNEAPGSDRYVSCMFDDPHVPRPDVDRLKHQRVTVQGRCKAWYGLLGTVGLDSCKLLK
jgi:hypothetical protein